MKLLTLLAAILAVLSFASASNFDLKYSVPDKALITPKSHPSLFSFTGRWYKRRDTYIASNWPGTYVTALVYGNNVTLILKPMNTGKVTDHKFSYSFDKGHIQEAAIQEYDSSISSTLELTLSVPEVPQEENVLVPRLLTIYSHADSPLRLHGLYMGNVVINEGKNWASTQEAIPRIEFVSNYNVSVAHNIFKELSFSVPEQLGVHHSHVTADICLTPDCYPDKYAMMEQYFYFHYFDGVRPKRGVDPKPAFFQFDRQDAFLPLNEPQVIVVDIGDVDMQKNIDLASFGADLKKFLATIMVQAYHDINHIFVLVKPGRYEKATYRAIEEIPSSRITPVYYGKQTPDWWKGFMCSNVIPATGKPFPYDSLCGNKSFTFSTKGVLGHSNVWIMLAGIIAISGGGFYFLKKRGGIYQGLPVTVKQEQ
ncbi:hypothetical protein CJU89_6637 [Yarrowia sp. B02]|nr:hypothetical protein CJU89_6637 [Yarrowia sp. B02]